MANATVIVEVAIKVGCIVCGEKKFSLHSPYVCHSCWQNGDAALMIQQLKQNQRVPDMTYWQCETCGWANKPIWGICFGCKSPRKDKSSLFPTHG